MALTELEAAQNARSVRAWNRAALAAHFTLYGFVGDALDHNYHSRYR